jgi:L-seryl-tRNA(Ser) seleniumtransferase
VTFRDVYAELGVRHVLNAATTFTALGGTTLPQEVVEAMASAATSCVSMEELHLAAGRRVAEITRNEAALVTSGAAAAICLAVLAAVTAGRPELIARLPDDETLERRVVIHRAHRIPYDRAVELVGGHLVEVGNVIQTFEWELHDALGRGAAAVLWVAGDHLPSTVLSLETTVRIAHEYSVPVIVDAAAQLPPVSNLWHFTRECGCDLVLFSGGKALRGPQASGVLLGRADLVEAARLNAAPFQRLARAMKAGKEEVCGLWAALERYVALDHEKQARDWTAAVDSWVRDLSDISSIVLRRLDTNEAGQPVARLEVDCVTAPRSRAVASRLWENDPRIAVLEVSKYLYVSPDVMNEGDYEYVMQRLRGAIAATVDEEEGGNDVG